MSPASETTTNTAKSGLAILFAAIDYHQSSNQISSLTPPPSSTPSQPIESSALNPNMFSKRGTYVDVKWSDEGKLTMRQKMNRRSFERFHSRQIKQVSTELASSIPLPGSVTVIPSSPISLHSAPDYDDSSTIGSAQTVTDDLLTLDDSSISSNLVETCHKQTMIYEAAYQATSDQTMTALRPSISIDSDDLDALMKQQQQRMFVTFQKTNHSRAMLHGMRGRSLFVS
ncbi:hypothetical protein QTG54_005536 [Skeletonema marinoi]|uniref:Uncharacterized protein n=1 Tax=Skeletonema marinoi TaxID=267567 RepID=A0AAD9DF75_9STRA|nr:hypothetical protein QTG54_005536 [Skeletonema marinoi]